MKTHIFCLTIITSMFTACDVEQPEDHLATQGESAEQELSHEQEMAEDRDVRRRDQDVPEEVGPFEGLTEFDFTDLPDGVEGPPGMTCCVDCGDGWSGWYNLGTADNCNSRGATFCSNNWWYFINAEWRYSC
ncbi:hypothetical protein [Nannocystis sp. SCPEA4]|uniref:hypothetical protein n=1 Tax=Nannocystis sp. SCPEA4 TaxID=2996787 RepID=UPI0022709C0D|nr:hypothetical protein [Nannocystis sp. SCPEA4]MCY1060218.1 hypothetical protein [Nannocystis sp. SCPEA4]